MTVPGETQPTLPLPADPDAAPATRRRTRWPWVIAAAAVAVLLVGGAFAAEQVARNIVTDTIREQTADALGAAPGELAVSVSGVVIPQLLAGSLDEVVVSSADVALGELQGALTLTATGLPVSADAAAERITAHLELDEDQLRALLDAADGVPAGEVTIGDDDITYATELRLFALTVPLSLSVVPAVSDGDIALDPVRITLAGAEISADGLRERFGSLADGVLSLAAVCIADRLPAGATLTDAAIVDGGLSVDADIDGRILVDESLQQPGSCG